MAISHCWEKDAESEKKIRNGAASAVGVIEALGIKRGISYRAAFGGLVGACLIAALGLVFAATSAFAAPTLGLTATDAVIGGTIHATAELSESPDASGEISFEVFGPGDPACLGPALTPTPASVPVDGEGEYFSEFVPAEAGVYHWSAHYSGDGENLPADSTCSAISTVAKASPAIAGFASSRLVGTAIHDEAIVTGGFSLTGAVTFSVYGPADTECQTPLETGSVPLEAGEAVSGDFIPLQAGEFRWIAAYSGDANNEAVGTACGAPQQSSIVSKASPSLAGVATLSAVVGTPITDSATLSGGFQPGGQLVFKAYGPGDVTCSTAAKYEATVPVSGNGVYSPAGFSPPVGLYRWTVAYSGDGNNQAVNVACGAAQQTSTVSKASPSLTGVATPVAVAGSPITDSATLAGGFEPGGQVVFKAYGPSDANCTGAVKYEATVPVSGNGVYSPAGFSPPVGLYRWTVAYSGDTNNKNASTVCNASEQASTVDKALPSLAGVATSATIVGSQITDNATLAGGFQPGGQLVFKAYGPADATCSTPPKHEATVSVAGNGVYSTGFSPPAGLYRWTVAYSGDANNQAVSTACGAAEQASAVGTLTVSLTAGAGSGTVGEPLTATASIQNGATPGGQITFKAFPPSDANCSGAAAFSSTINVSGGGPHRSAAFVPTRVGVFRWTVTYAGDPNHAPTASGCGGATSSVSQARPSVVSGVEGRFAVGRSLRVTATLRGAYAPRGTVSFQLYGPAGTSCGTPLAVNTVAIAGSTVRSDPFVPERPGRYTFVASYSGDAANQGATEACDPSGRVAEVAKRSPKVKPRARLKEGKTITIRARLSGALSPSGVVNFRLYRPGDTRCKRKPVFNGGVTVKSNGSYLLAEYLVSKPGIYRLNVGYSGDQRNRRYTGTCSGAQMIRVD